MLPGKKSDRGQTAADNRLFLEAVLGSRCERPLDEISLTVKKGVSSRPEPQPRPSFKRFSATLNAISFTSLHLFVEREITISPISR